MAVQETAVIERAVESEVTETGAASSVSEIGAWLVAHRWQTDRGEAAWLDALARFDVAQGWYADGALSCVEWLMWHAKLARATAFEKLRVAHQLRRRPLLAEAFGAGRVSYCALRALARVEDPDAEVDAALVALAEIGTVVDVERAVRAYQLHADQDRPPAEAARRRGVRVMECYDGTTQLVVTLTDAEAAEAVAVLQAFIDHPHGPSHLAAAVQPQPVDESTRADSSRPVPAAAGPSGAGPGAVDQSTRVDAGVPMARFGRGDPGRRADAFVELCRVAAGHGPTGAALGSDRYLVHVVHVAGHSQDSLVDGTPLEAGEAARLACDCSTVAHVVGERGEPLALGRRSRLWSAGQRRAILVRDGGHCRFPGCERRLVDVHHQRPWGEGGATDVDNGYLLCAHHHTLLHAGFRATGSPNFTLSFTRPDGGVVGTTAPQASPGRAGDHGTTPTRPRPSRLAS